MGIKDIIELILEYGLVPMAMAVGFYIIIKGQKEIERNNQTQARFNEDQSKKNQAISDVLTHILERMVNVERDTDHSHSHSEEIENGTVNTLIRKQLDKLLCNTNANRVCCFLYHNGGYSVNGRSFQKMSMMFETIDMNTVSIMRAYQNVPRAMLPILFDEIKKNGYYYINDIKEIETIDPMTYQWFKTRGTKSAYIRGIMDINKTVLGFIDIEFSMNSCSDLSLLQDDLKNTAINISGMLQASPVTTTKQEGVEQQ